MPVTLQITDGTTTVDFTTTSGHQLEDGYLPTFAMPAGDGTIPPYITEAIPCHVNITSGNNLASSDQAFHALQLVAVQFTADETYITPVWFHRQLADESGAVRFLVRSMHFTPNANFGGPIDTSPCLTDGRQGVLTIDHHPYGERTTAVSASTGTNLSVLGGGAAYNYTDVVGDVPARPYYIRLYGGSIGIEFEKVWMGFRSDAKIGSGDASDYIALWELEDATPGANGTASPDGTASPGGGNTYMEVDPTDTTWESGFNIDTNTVKGDTDVSMFNGTFLVLMRAKVDTATCQVKLKHRQTAADSPAKTGSVIDVVATAWTIYNLGLVTFPTANRRAFPIALKNATHDRAETLELWCRDKPGDTGAVIDCDCFVLIPVDEYFVYNHFTGIESTLESWMAVAPDDEAAGSTLATTGDDWWYEPNPTQIIGAGMPVGDGRMFICVAKADDAAPAYDDDIDVDLSWYPRWISYRGAE